MIPVMVSNWQRALIPVKRKILELGVSLCSGVWYVALILVTEETIQATQREDGDAGGAVLQVVMSTVEIRSRP